MRAIKKARDAGLFVIALDTPPDPADTVDITFATDNFQAGELIGKWAAAQLGGQARDDRAARPLRRQDRLGRLRARPGLPDRDGHRHRRREEERRRGPDRQLQRRRPTRSSATMPTKGAEDGGQHGHGELPLQEPRHQRRLHDQRAGRERRLQGAARPPARPRRSFRRRRLRRRQARSRTASSAPPRSSTPSRWPRSASRRSTT